MLPFNTCISPVSWCVIT